MPAICTNCKKQFLRFVHHIRESHKLKHTIYCSRKCVYEHKTTAKLVECKNSSCSKKFYRNIARISTQNYCSRSCAAIVNNKKYPKWPARYCLFCTKPHNRNGSPYCSPECGKAGRFTYTKDEMLDLIRLTYHQTGRVPAKREVKELSDKCAHLFGTWNNAIIAAGLTPHRSDDHRMYKRTMTKARDGHVCDSISEAIIDNWLTEHNIHHQRNAAYPNTGHKSDWAIKKGKVFVEYFGLAQDSPRYNRTVKEKVLLCRKNHIKLVCIYPQDLYPHNRLDNVFKSLMT